MKGFRYFANSYVIDEPPVFGMWIKWKASARNPITAWAAILFKIHVRVIACTDTMQKPVKNVARIVPHSNIDTGVDFSVGLQS